MPNLNLEDGPQSLAHYDVVGQCDNRPSRFVTHVGLHNADNRSVEMDNDVSAVHMRPPLEAGTVIKAHVAGHVPLTTDEIKEISAWIEVIRDEYATHNADRVDQYIIDPPWEDKRDPNTGVRRYRRYSCAGFVLDGHSEVNIELLKIDKNASPVKIDTSVLPDVNKLTVMSAYPAVGGRPTVLQQFGLKGNGPWKIVLAGYVLHALDRPTEQIRQQPYRAQPGDERF